MKSFILILGVVLICTTFVNGQNSQSRPVAQTTPNQSLTQPNVNESFQKLKFPPDSSSDYSISDLKVLNADIQSVYRKTNKDKLKMISSAKSDIDRFAIFLQQPKTGLIKLIPDKGCDKDTYIISADSDCLVYTMPGYGSSYSFRIKDYRIKRLADLTFVDGNLKISGFLVQGMLVNIGDVDLGNTNLKSTGVAHLVDFKPVDKYEEAKKSSDIYTRGIFLNGYIYRRELRSIVNNTFVLRSIAYNRNSFSSHNDRKIYDEFEFDKRKDVIIAFRIVNKDEKDGSITILWKELARKNSPKIKNKNEKTKK